MARKRGFRLAVALVAAAALAGLGASCGGGSGPLAITSPTATQNFTSGSVTVRVAWDSTATPSGLHVLLNGNDVLPTTPASGSTSIQFTVDSSQGVVAGRNLLTAWVPSTASDAVLNGGYEVRHRVFYFQDADLDGVPDGSDPDTSNADADGDGLNDGVEVKLASALGTRADGVAQITSVQPNPLIAGQPVALFGSGFESVASAAQVTFGGAPATALLHASPSSLVVLAPPGLGGSSVNVAVAPAGSGTPGAYTASVYRGSSQSFENLVLISSVRSQIFYDANGNFFGSQENIPFFENMMQLGTATRVLIDASKVDPTIQPAITPDLQSVLQLDGFPNVTTRLTGSLGQSVLSGYDTLVILLAGAPVPLTGYSASEIADIQTWLQTQGHRLILIPDTASGNQAEAAANLLLAGIGAGSRFDTSFPSETQQEPAAYDTYAIFADPPLTNGISSLFYLVPGNISLGAGAREVAQVGICLSGETGIIDSSGILVGCQPAEGQPLQVIPAEYVATEMLPTQAPSVQITTLTTAAGSVSVPANPMSLLEVPVGSALTVEAAYTGASPISASVNGMPASIDRQNQTLTATLDSQHFDFRSPATGIRVELITPASTVADSVVVRTHRQRIQLHIVDFIDDNGNVAIRPSVLAAALRQAGLEYGAVCQGQLPNQPGLDDVFGVQAIDQLHLQDGYDLLAEVDGMDSVQAVNLLNGLNPDGSSNASLPSPPDGTKPVNPVRLFISGDFRRTFSLASGQATTQSIPQNTETGRSLFGIASVTEGAAIVQASSHDLEAGPLEIDRPVASSLAHELGHAAAGVSDDLAEEPRPGVPALPNSTTPSLMNTFPYFRTLNLAKGGVIDCNLNSLGSPPQTSNFCSRLLTGFSCQNSVPSNLPLDFTE